jgi:hypothetical protein
MRTMMAVSIVGLSLAATASTLPSMLAAGKKHSDHATATVISDSRQSVSLLGTADPHPAEKDVTQGEALRGNLGSTGEMTAEQLAKVEARLRTANRVMPSLENRNCVDPVVLSCGDNSIGEARSRR